MTDNLFAAAAVGTHSLAAVADAPVVRDRRRRGQRVELVGTISGFDIVESTVTLTDVQDGRRRHPELTVALVAGATITIDGLRRVFSALPIGEKAIVTGDLDGTLVTSRELHALTLIARRKVHGLD
ncbi:hypothetical protein [Cryptosporangium sp. NPDC048952]|uniref:hypothetical protein n=1 Tax=Cryptosporangium sp. NPDC048952 TaxID=3363961 RepID=UPI00372166FF